MTKTMYMTVLIAAVWALAMAQGTAQQQALGAALQYSPAAERTIQGTIQQVVQGQGPVGTRVIVSTQQGPMDVALGPQQFVQQQNLNLTPGAPITITGAPTMIGGQQLMLAREVQQSGRTVMFRNAQGAPAWSGAMMQGQQMGQGMMGGRMRGANIYNPQTETTVSGTVQEVSHYICGPWAGTYTILSTPQGPVNAQLGPSEYLQQQNLWIRPGDQIEVTGSRLNIDGVDVLLARSVTSAGQTVTLRNQQGMPMWAGGWSGWGTPTAMASVSGVGIYDPNTVQTVTGVIDRVWNGVPAAGMERTRMITIRRADDSRLDVALGPEAFIGQSSLPLTVGDSVTVTGSLVAMGRRQRTVLLASQIQEGSQQLTLRDTNGNPAWAVAMAPSTVASAQASGSSASASATIGQPASGVPYGSSNQPNTGTAMPGSQANAGAQTY